MTAAEYSIQVTQCNQLLNQAIAQYCNNLQTYDATRCAYVNTPQTVNLLEIAGIIAQQGKTLLF